MAGTEEEIDDLIAPLQKRNEGKAYSRPPEIEATLQSLAELPIAEVARRAKISDVDDPEYVPSECVLYFVRKSRANGDTPPYHELFAALRDRTLRAVPVRLRRVAGLSKPAGSHLDEQIRERVMFDFQELLCLDWQSYDERLDFYEIRFNAAIATLRATARRAILGKESRRKPMQYEGDGAELTLKMEQALERARSANGQKDNDFPYRLRLYEAISTLPPDERRVVELLLKGETIDSIRKILGCVEKTVRNRRNRAYAAIREALEEEYSA